MKLEKPPLFFFGSLEKSARIHIKRSVSNVFITLTDLNNKVIAVQSAGSALETASRRQKSSPYAVEAIVRKLLAHLKRYEVKSIQLVLRLKISTHVHFLIKELNFYGFSISHVFERKKTPHNGVRSRKRPRK